MSSGSKTTGSVTSSPSFPLMNDAMGTAKSVFNSGAAWAPNTTSMVSPFSTQTRAGLTGMNNAAIASAPDMADNFNRVNSAYSSLGANGLTSLQDQQVNRLQNQASGGMLQNNPYLNEVIKRSSQDIAGANALTASGAGRYGSGMAQDVTERNIGDMSSNLRYQDYGRERGYMQDAIGSLFNAGQQGLSNINGGTGALQDAYQARLSPYQTQTGVGSAYENKNQQVLQDSARVLQERKNSQTDPVNWLANLSAQFGGGKVQSTQQPSNPFGDAINAYGSSGSLLQGLLGGIGGIL